VNKIETSILTIESSIKECESHVKRISRVVILLKDSFPISSEILKEEDDEIISHIDQLIYRFTKLQDSMGTRLLPSLYTYLENNDRPVPFLDILNRFEKLEVISSASEWQFFRNLRNNLAHDYPDSVDQTVNTLNVLYAEIEGMLNLFRKSRDYYKQRKTL